MVEWSVAAFRAAASVGAIVVAVPPGSEHGDLRDELKLGRGGVDAVAGRAVPDEDGIDVVAGGATRAESVSHALELVGTDLVAIHDAARPLVTPELIEETIATLVADPDADGAIAATPVTDTIKQVGAMGEAKEAATPLGCNALSPDKGDKALHPPEKKDARPGCNALSPYEVDKALHRIELTLDRGRLWAAQTPQVFRVAALRAALAADPERVASATDEAMLVEGAGGRVLIHPAPPENLKVTTPLDLKVAESLLAAR